LRTNTHANIADRHANIADKQTCQHCGQRDMPTLRTDMPTLRTNRHANIADKQTCQHCGQTDNLIHRLTECREVADIWRRTRSGIATILRIDPNSTEMDSPSEYSLLATTEAKGNSVDPSPRGVLPYWHRVSNIEYADSMRSARGKTCQTVRRRENVGNYLEIL
jgi:hypothetical protein